jgi:hypothetical protein
MERVFDFLTNFGGTSKHNIWIECHLAWVLKRYWAIFNLNCLANHLVKTNQKKNIKKRPLEEHEILGFKIEEINMVYNLPLEDKLKLSYLNNPIFLLEKFQEILLPYDHEMMPTDFLIWESDIHLYERLFVVCLFFDNLMNDLKNVTPRLYFYLDAELTKYLICSCVKLYKIEGEEYYKKFLIDSRKKGKKSNKELRIEAVFEEISAAKGVSLWDKAKNIEETLYKNWEAAGKPNPKPYKQHSIYNILKGNPK